MDWKDIKGTVGKLAPIAGTLLGGPAGALVGGIIASALGVENTADAVATAVATDPAKALELAKFESDNRVKLQGMAYAHADALIAADVAMVQADAADRASAREREAAVKDNTPRVLAYILVFASVALGIAVVSGYVTKDPVLAGTVGTVIGYVFSEAKQVLSYYFGSTSGSARKTELIAKATPAAEPNASTGP